MGSVWVHTEGMKASRTHELLSLDYMPGTVLEAVHLESILTDSLGQVAQVEFWRCSLTQAGFFLRVLGVYNF